MPAPGIGGARQARPVAKLWWRIARPFAVVGAILLLVLVAAAWIARGPLVLSAPRVDTFPADPTRLEATVRFLSETCAPRSYRTPENLERAASFIEQAFRDAGDRPESQVYQLREGSFRNVIVRREGSRPELGMVVIGAHYDAYIATPGADDNASGVAVLLELARLTAKSSHHRTQVFACFSTEEPPFFGSPDMGSARFAEGLRAGNEDVHLMIALDLVGVYCDEPGCQPYPFAGMSLFYPSRGDFIAVAGDIHSGRAIEETKRGIAAADVMPFVSFRAPRSMGFVDLSDHVSFWASGYPGVLVTDTAMLRNPRYHGPRDSAETLDYASMAKVVQALQGVLLVADDAG